MGYRKETYAWSLTLFLVFFVIYTKFMSYDFNFDGIVFADVIEHPSAEGLFHGNHLLFNYVHYKLYFLLQKLGIVCRGIFFLSVMDAFWGALGIALFYLLLRRYFTGLLALCGSLLLGCSFSYWYYSVEAQVYQIANIPMIISLGLLLALTRKENTTNGKFIVLGLIHASGVLFHIINVLLWPVINAVIYRTQNDRKWQKLIIYNVFFFSSVIAGYAVAARYILHLSSWSQFWKWFLGNAYTLALSKETYWNTKIWMMLGSTFTGWVDTWLSWPGNHIWKISRMILVVSSVLLLVKAFKNGKTVWPAEKEKVILALLWLGTYSLFLSVWCQGNIGYRLFIVPVFIFLVLLLIKSSTTGKKIWFLILACVVLLIYNLANGIYPRSIPANNQTLLKTMFIGENIPLEGYLIMGGNSFPFALGRVYVPYFTGFQGTSLYGYFYRTGEKDFTALGQLINERLNKGKKVFLLSEVLKDNQGKAAFEYNFSLPAGSIDRFFSQYSVSSFKKYNDDVEVFQLKKK